jgi:hypothetical protein
MTFIEIRGRVNEKGELEFDPPHDLPAGEVRIMIEVLDPEAGAADEALWDEQFANSQGTLSKIAEKIRAARKAGLTEPFDPDIETP